MKRIIIYSGLCVVVLSIGILGKIISSKISARAPLRITLSSIQPADTGIPVDHYTVRIENVSAKNVRGYSLGHTCNCRSWDSNDNPYPPGISYTNPLPERQLLRPGEVQEMPLAANALGSEPAVWADLVHFENSANWGMNQSHKDGYVRGY